MHIANIMVCRFIILYVCKTENKYVGSVLLKNRLNIPIQKLCIYDTLKCELLNLKIYRMEYCVPDKALPVSRCLTSVDRA